MERTAVRSKDLAIVGYDREQQMLEIAFRSGGVYHYEGVSADVYHELMQAPSLGIFFRDRIRPDYPCKKIACPA